MQGTAERIAEILATVAGVVRPQVVRHGLCHGVTGGRGAGEQLMCWGAPGYVLGFFRRAFEVLETGVFGMATMSGPERVASCAGWRCRSWIRPVLSQHPRTTTALALTPAVGYHLRNC